MKPFKKSRYFHLKIKDTVIISQDEIPKNFKNPLKSPVKVYFSSVSRRGP